MTAMSKIFVGPGDSNPGPPPMQRLRVKPPTTGPPLLLVMYGGGFIVFKLFVMCKTAGGRAGA
jgi:hypothetical protein